MDTTGANCPNTGGNASPHITPHATETAAVNPIAFFIIFPPRPRSSNKDLHTIGVGRRSVRSTVDQLSLLKNHIASPGAAATMIIEKTIHPINIIIPLSITHLPFSFADMAGLAPARRFRFLFT